MKRIIDESSDIHTFRIPTHGTARDLTCVEEINVLLRNDNSY
jgi:hypothetical protein